jgi:hypothetical protein
VRNAAERTNTRHVALPRGERGLEQDMDMILTGLDALAPVVRKRAHTTRSSNG